MGWFGNTEEDRSNIGKELVAATAVIIDSNFTYYLGEDGNVWRKSKTQNEMVASAGVYKEKKYHYYITTGGNVSRIPKHLLNNETFDEDELKSLIETNADNYTNADIYIGIKDSMIKKARLHVENMNYNAAIDIYAKLKMENQVEEITDLIARDHGKSLIEKIGNIAKDKEEHLDYDTAITLYDKIGDKKSAKRVRKLKSGQAVTKVKQTVIHGDYVDDRDTIVKDSVLNRSTVGGGSSKMQELKDLTEMKKEGLIDDGEFKQMKKEILGR